MTSISYKTNIMIRRLFKLGMGAKQIRAHYNEPKNIELSNHINIVVRRLRKQNHMKELAEWCLDKIVENPRLAEQINDFYKLCHDEVEAGESLENEVELCKNSILELLT